MNNSFVFSEVEEPSQGMAVNMKDELVAEPIVTEPIATEPTLAEPISKKSRKRDILCFACGGLVMLKVLLCVCCVGLVGMGCCIFLVSAMAAGRMGPPGGFQRKMLMPLGCVDSQEFEGFEFVKKGVSQVECSQLLMDSRAEEDFDYMVFAMTKSDECFLIKRPEKPARDGKEGEGEGEEGKMKPKNDLFDMLKNQDKDTISMCDEPCSMEQRDDEDRPEGGRKPHRGNGAKGQDRRQHRERPREGEGEEEGRKGRDSDERKPPPTCGDASGRYYTVFSKVVKDDDDDDFRECPDCDEEGDTDRPHHRPEVKGGMRKPRIDQEETEEHHGPKNKKKGKKHHHQHEEGRKGRKEEEHGRPEEHHGPRHHKPHHEGPKGRKPEHGKRPGESHEHHGPRKHHGRPEEGEEHQPDHHGKRPGESHEHHGTRKHHVRPEEGEEHHKGRPEEEEIEGKHEDKPPHEREHHKEGKGPKHHKED